LSTFQAAMKFFDAEKMDATPMETETESSDASNNHNGVGVTHASESLKSQLIRHKINEEELLMHSNFPLFANVEVDFSNCSPFVNRLIYEVAMFVASLPHMIPKWILLSWASLYLFRNLAYVRHEQGERLKDLGFELIPEFPNDFLGEVNLYVNLFTALFAVIMPLFNNVSHSKGAFGVDVYVKIVNMTCVGHVLRFATYISTSLPGPAPHCQPGAPLYRDSLTFREYFTRRSRVHVDPNCGDLIFSGHMFQVMTFSIVTLAHLNDLVRNRFISRIVSTILVVTPLLQPIFIIGARNHYTVDVVVSSYVAPLLYLAMERFYTTSFYKCSAKWTSTLIPTFLRKFLDEKNPCRASREEELLEINPELSDIVKKYEMIPKDILFLLDLHKSEPLGNKRLDSSNDGRVENIERKANDGNIFHRKGN